MLWRDPKMLIKHFHMVQTQIDQLTKVQKKLLVNASREKEKHVCEVTTRGGVSTQDPWYPEGHPKIIEQYSQRVKQTSASFKKKKKKHKTVVESSKPVNDPNRYLPLMLKLKVVTNIVMIMIKMMLLIKKK